MDSKGKNILTLKAKYFDTEGKNISDTEGKNISTLKAKIFQTLKAKIFGQIGLMSKGPV